MKTIIIILLSFAFSVSYAQTYNGIKQDYKLKPYKNNKVFKPRKEFIYNYVISSESISGKVVFSKNNSRDFRIDTIADSNSVIIDKIKLSVKEKNIFQRINFFQTQINYEFLTQSPFLLLEETGMVENESNIWLHPPRSYLFKMLELAPFPYIKLNKKIGDKWKDEIYISNYWADKRWATWNDKLKLEVAYKLVDKTKLDTKFGSIDVSIVSAESKSQKGVSTLYMIHSEDYGIIQLKYDILGKYKLQFDLDYTNRKK